MKKRKHKTDKTVTTIIESTKELLAFYLPGCIVAIVFVVITSFLIYIARALQVS